MKRTILTTLAVILVLLGIVLIGFTFYDAARSAYENEQLNEAFNRVLDFNQDVENKGVPVPEKILDEVSKEETTDVVIEKTSEEIEKERQDIKRSATYMDMQMVCKIYISGIDVDDVVVEGTDGYSISYALGHFMNTAWPGEVGNFSVCGHRGGKHGTFFKYLPGVNVGECIYVTDIYGDEYAYEVTESYVIEPNEFWVIDNETDGKKMITLITCTDNGTRRYVVKGELCEVN